MTIRENGGIFGRNPVFSAVNVEGDLTIADKIVHAGDTNTSIRFPAADTVTIETSGSERMRITSAGNVGIGTTTPSAKADLAHTENTRNGYKVTTTNNSGASEQGGFLAVNGNATGFFAGINGASYSTGGIGVSNEATIYSIGNVGLAFGTNTTRRARIASTGDISFYDSTGSTPKLFWNASTESLGIGTVTPSGKLDVAGSSVNFFNVSGTFTLNLTGAAICEHRLITSGATPGDWRFQTGNASSGLSGALRVVDVTANAERIRIDGVGNVGIGEAIPDYRLDVNGAIGFAPGASVTPVDNGDVVFELTNNTTLTIKAKGSDGVVRSAAITLA
jgi:hypothetical protein